MEVFIDILSHQDEFIFSDAIHTGIVGGFRSGKSQAGVMKTVKKKIDYPGIDVAYYLPTYGLIKDVAYPKFSKILSDYGIRYTLNKTDHEYLTEFGRIILRSMDNPDSIIGYEVGYSLVDEADILPIAHMNDVFTKAVARLSVPLPDGLPNSLDFVSTPEGFKFLYDFFVKNAHQDKVLIKANTRNNPFISKSYITTLEMSYTPQQLEAYLNGEFVNLTSGTVYHHFDRARNHSDRIIQPNDVLHIGMDFNITKMNAVVHVIDGKAKTAVAEIVNAYDTPEMIGLIKSRFPGHSIVVYPDASGNARKSVGGGSDIDLLRQAKFTVRVGSQNPFVKSRVNAMNIAFKDATGLAEYFVNTNNCPVYTEALERQTYKNGEPDKTSGFDHVTEAGGYFIYDQQNARINVRSSNTSTR